MSFFKNWNKLYIYIYNYCCRIFLVQIFGLRNNKDNRGELIVEDNGYCATGIFRAVGKESGRSRGRLMRLPRWDN